MPRGKAATPLTDEQKAAKENEKHTKFVELVEKRTTNALNAISGLRSLSNRSSYSYSPAEAKAVYDALIGEVNKTMAGFQPGGTVAKGGFTLATAVTPAVESA